MNQLDRMAHRLMDLRERMIKRARRKGHHDPEEFVDDVCVRCCELAAERELAPNLDPLINFVFNCRLADFWRGEVKEREVHAFCMQTYNSQLTSELREATERDVDESSTSSTSESRPKAEKFAGLHAELDGLSRKSKAIVMARYWDESTEREIAERFSMTLNGVRSALKRSRNSLRSRLAEPA